ncbi:MAG: cytochrome c oxidase subunit 3 [Bacteroidetes bacterium]|nr:cytochrome c oxidase subunit 3 [Bacteroidota bacterium]MBL0066757.1 cytochrome c oxidase subunit 3 [Bacteroidota bacterium]MBL0138590.1 cytochrome c oxidase subunit 3 [Bacteroidota bacterium]
MIAELIPNERTLLERKAKRSLLWIGVISILMLFAGLTSGYIVRQGEGKWAQFDLPMTFAISTVIIVLSSIPMQWAVISAGKGNQKNLVTALIITALLGIAFVISQYVAWSELFSQGIAFSGRIKDIKGNFQYVPSGSESVTEAGDAGNVAGSFLYVITGLHVMHLLGGLIALFIVFSRALRQKYTATDFNGVRMCAVYWHFLGGLWVYLFFFLLYVR